MTEQRKLAMDAGGGVSTAWPFLGGKSNSLNLTFIKYPFIFNLPTECNQEIIGSSLCTKNARNCIFACFCLAKHAKYPKKYAECITRDA